MKTIWKISRNLILIAIRDFMISKIQCRSIMLAYGDKNLNIVENQCLFCFTRRYPGNL